MKPSGPWQTDDFDSLHWHDTHVHGFHLDNYDSESGTADLTFDIDYLLTWHGNSPDDELLFTVCRAALVFHKACNLKFCLEYTGSVAAGMCPFALHTIEREPLIFANGETSFQWSMPIDWPAGEILFQAPAFTLSLTGTPIVQLGQWLASPQRNHHR